MASVHKNKKPCKYGESCYRKNEDHLKNFAHDEEAGKESSDHEDIENKMALKNAKGAKRGRQATKAEDEPVAKKAEPQKPDASKEETSEKVEKLNLDQVNDVKELVFEHNSMHRPDEFYDFLDFCKQLDPQDPKSRTPFQFVSNLKSNVESL